MSQGDKTTCHYKFDIIYSGQWYVCLALFTAELCFFYQIFFLSQESELKHQLSGRRLIASPLKMAFVFNNVVWSQHTSHRLIFTLCISSLQRRVSAEKSQFSPHTPYLVLCDLWHHFLKKKTPKTISSSHKMGNVGVWKVPDWTRQFMLRYAAFNRMLYLSLLN